MRPHMLLLLPFLVIGLLSTLLHAFTILHTLPWTLTYSDVLVFFPKAAGFPYLQTPIEYPVLTGLFLWLAGQAGTLAGYYAITAAVFILAAAIAVVFLSKMQGVTTRNLLTFFILTPSLLFFLVYNWDILAVASATAALFFLSRNKPLPAAALLAVGFSFKFYPVLFLLPLLLKEVSHKKRIADIGVFAAVALLINVPFMLLSFDGWAHFYRFSAERMPNFDSVWWFASSAAELSVPAINTISLALFLAGTLVLFWKKRELSAVQLCLPLLLLFLLTTKVFSPQYTLWLLPLFVLFPPRKRGFYLLEGTNVLVLLTILPWAFGQPQEPFLLTLSGVFVGVRHVALLFLLKESLQKKGTLDAILSPPPPSSTAPFVLRPSAQQSAPGKDTLSWRLPPSSIAPFVLHSSAQQSAPGKDTLSWRLPPSSTAPFVLRPSAQQSAPGKDTLSWRLPPSSTAPFVRVAPVQQSAPGKDTLSWRLPPSSTAPFVRVAPVQQSAPGKDTLSWRLPPSSTASRLLRPQ